MITFRSPTLPLNGELQWQRVDLAHVSSQTLDVYLGISSELIDRLVINGEVVEPDSVALCTPNDGDEITVIPKVGGSNRGVIAGVLGGIVAIAAVVVFPWLAPFIGGLYAGAFATGFAVASLIYALAHPARRADGDKTGNTYTFDGITNEDREGVAQPVVLGDDRTGGVRVDSFVRIGMFPDPDNPGAYKKGTRSYQLINVSKARYGIEGISEVRANNEPVENFHAATWAYTKGETPEQWYDGQTGNPIPRPEAFDVSANTFTQSQELTTSPYVYTTSPTSSVDAVEALIAFPSGIVHTHKGSDKDNTTRYKIRYRLHSSSTWLPCPAPGFDGSGIRTVKKNSHAADTEPVRIQGLTPGRYDLEFTWISADFNSTSGDDIDSWKAFLIGVTEEVSNAQPKPGYALLAVSALAVEQLNGAPPVISCRCKGIKVPWWDGSSWQAPTWVGPDSSHPIGRNPAWLLLEAHRDGDNTSTGYTGWGLGLPDEKVYLPGWKAFADKCNRSVTVIDDQSNTWTEPMHQLDTTLNEQRPFDTLIRDLLATARAAPVMAGNGAQHGVFYDDADDPVQLVTMGNMVTGSFQPVYDFSPRKNTFDVTFRDRDHDFATVTRTVANATLVTKYGTDREGISMEGVTRWSQVKRDTFYNLKKHEAAKVPLSFEMRTDAILWRIGQVIDVQHRQPGWGIDGGRVRLGTVAPNTNTTTRVVTPLRAHASGGSTFVTDVDGSDILVDLVHSAYEVRVRLADGSGEEGQRRDVSSVAVSTDGYLIVTVSTPFTSAPQFNDPIAFGEFQKSVKPYRCLAISQSANSFRRVSCIDYNASVYAPTGPLETINYSSLPLYGGPPPPIPAGSAVAREDLAAQNTNVNLSSVIIQWGQPVRTAGYGFYDGADIEVSEDSGVTYKLLPGRAHGTEYRWNAAPHEVALIFRITPVSSAGRTNLDGRAVTSPVTCHGSQTIPATASGLAASVEGDAFVWRWNDISREMQYEVRDADSAFGTADTHRLFIGRATEFKIVGPTVRSKTVYVRAFQPMAAAGTTTPIYSSASATATASKAPPSPPTIGVRTANGDTIKIPVGSASGTDVTGIRLWASQTNGFTPSAATQVAQVIPASGGDFLFHITTPGTWYFRVAATDALTDRLGDYSYSSQFTSGILVLAPQNPTSVTFAQNATPQRRQAVTHTPGQPPATTKVFSLFLNWSFSDSVNPAGSHVGFYAELYESGGDPEVPYLSVTIADPNARTWPISDITFEDSATWVGAVKALYIEGGESSLITSTGLALNPATGDDVLAQLKTDANGGYYFNQPTKLVDAAGMTILLDKNGVHTVDPLNGTLRSPRRVAHALLSGAANNMAVAWSDAKFDKAIIPVTSLTKASKLHIVAEIRSGPSVDKAPTFYPTRVLCEAVEIQDNGFRMALSQTDGGTSHDDYHAAPTPAGWTPTSSLSSIMHLVSSFTPTDTQGNAAWVDPFAASWLPPIPLKQTLWLAADMPTVLKPDGTHYYVDFAFAVQRSTQGTNLVWNGSYASLPAGSYNAWGPITLRAYTDGKRWRVPWTALFPNAIGNSFIMWWFDVTYETGTNAGVSAPTRVLFDASEVVGVSGGSVSYRGSTGGNEAVDVLFVEDF